MRFRGNCCGNERDAFTAPPGQAPFSKVLQARRIERQGHDTFELSEIRDVAPSATQNDTDRTASTTTTPLLPKLGEVLPVEPRARVQTQVVDVQQRHVPATGRVLDLYV